MALGAVDTTAALRRLVQSAAIRRVAGTWIIPTTDKEHETLATNLGIGYRLNRNRMHFSSLISCIKTNINTRYSIEFCVHVNVLFYHLCILPDYKVNVLLYIMT